MSYKVWNCPWEKSWVQTLCWDTWLLVSPKNNKCHATIIYGPNKGWLCINQSKNGTLFCKCHNFFAINNKDGSLEKLPQSRAIVENGVHHRQCDHTIKKASLFCDIHKNRKPDVIKTLHMAFKILEQINRSREEWHKELWLSFTC